MITGQNFIAGKRSAKGSNKFKTFNPELNQENSWEFTEATSDELNLALDAAAEAFQLYSRTDDHTRALLLREIASNIEAMGDELLDVYTQESGLSKSRARSERTRTLFQLNMFADFIETENWRGTLFEAAEPKRSPKPKPSLYKTYIPLGPVAVFGASNFPFAYSTAGGDTASALAVGCPVIVKSHPMHAGTGELVAMAITTAIQELELHPGIFSNLNSSGIEIGKQLVEHQNIKAVGFTGSINGGRALFDLAAKREEPIPVFAEMGSINPVIISPKSLKDEREKWVDIYTDSILNGTGQFCTNPGLILGIASKELDEFGSKLAERFGQNESTVMLHPNIHENFKEDRKDALNQQGVQQLTVDFDTKTNYAEQTMAAVSGAEFLKNPTLHHEVFGPYSLIVQCQDIKEIEKIIHQLEGQLTGTLIAKDEELKSMGPLIHALSKRVGRVIFNGVPTGVEVTQAMTHGGPYPASTDSRFTAVGVDAVKRWLRPVTYQNFTEEMISDFGY